MYYTPTGGRRAEERDMQRLRDALIGIGRARGFPDGASDDSRLEFDREAAVILHSTMNISPNEASRSGVWEFIACVLLCDLVRWRFPGGSEGTPIERFVGGRRNTFQRLWRRALVFADPDEPEDRYRLLYLLGEDEAVQIMERPFLAGTMPLARAIARQLVAAADRHKPLTRRDLIRDAQKRMRRLAYFTAFDAVEPDALDAEVASIFEQAAESTRKRLASTSKTAAQ